MSAVLKKHQANFSLSETLLRALRETVPSGKQSSFVEHAIEKELRHKQFLEALDVCAGAWSKKKHPEKTEVFIRSLRESRRS